jgi:hypothetical protein
MSQAYAQLLPFAVALRFGGTVGENMRCVPGMAQYILKEMYDYYPRGASPLLASW